MSSRKPILDELKNASPWLANNNPGHPYRVPDDYFAQLADHMLLRIRAEQAKTAEEEIELLSPLLSRLDRKAPFSVPEGYFENLSPRAADSTSASGKLVTGSFSRKIYRYAAAAVIAGLVLVGGWLMVNQRSASDQLVAATDDSSSRRELINKVQQLSDTEMAAFVEGSPFVSPYATAPVTADIRDEDVPLMLANLSDQELEQYLMQTNSTKENFN